MMSDEGVLFLDRESPQPIIERPPRSRFTRVAIPAPPSRVYAMEKGP